MKKIRLVPINFEATAQISNLSIRLSKLQSEFSFELDDSYIKLNPKKKTNGVYPDSYLFEELESYMRKNHFDEFPVGIVNSKLPEGIISTSYKEGAIISTHQWKTFSKIPLERGLAYVIAYLILDPENEIMSIHEDSRSCPNDYCDDLSEIDKGILHGEFCEECKRDIFAAIEAGKLSWLELASIYRMLDYAADKRVCFVIMPFNKKLDIVYNNIKHALEKLDFHVIRSDEVFQPRSVMHIINENIVRADLVIADLTGKSANVFYELGYAHAFGKNAILIAQNKKDVPFDLQHRQFFLYKPDKALKSALVKGFQQYLAP